MSSYTITDGQKALFLERGYLLLENAVPQELLGHWQSLAARLEKEAIEARRESRELHGVCVVEDPVGPRVARYDDILGIDPQACFSLLACPAMMAAARELSGRGTVPLQLDIL